MGSVSPAQVVWAGVLVVGVGTIVPFVRAPLNVVAGVLMEHRAWMSS
jgi:hypothetical protein